MSEALVPCKDCGRMIGKRERVCPGCGRRSVSNLWDGFAMLVVVLILVGVLSAVCRRVTHRVIDRSSSSSSAKGR